jgi:hypothetical protein
MQLSGIPTKFPVVWAAGQTSTYVRPVPVTYTGAEVGAASFTLGFPAATFIPLASGGAPPDGRDTNGILQEITEWNQWQQAGGPIQYDSSFQASIGGYPQGAIVQSIATFGKSWLSTVDNNTTNPDTGGAGWEIYPQYLPATGVAAGTYTLLSGTVGADGRITSASATTSINISGSIVSGTEVYAPILATTGTGYIGVGSGASTFGGTITASGGIYANGGVSTTNVVASGLVNSAGGGTLGGVVLSGSEVTAASGANFGSGTVTCGVINASGNVNAPNFVASGVVNSTGGGTLGGVVLSGSEVTAASGANFGSGTVTAGNISSGGTLTAVDVTATNQMYAEGPLIALGAASLEGGCTVYGSITLYTAGTGSGAWECQIPAGGSTVALESNIGIVGGSTTYTTGVGYLYGGSGVVSGNNETGTFGLITTVGAVASGFHTTSDARLKDDLVVISPEMGINFIRKVDPYTWNWNDKPATEEKRASGYVSQQLIVAGFPELVTSFPVKELPAATHTFNGEEISSNANFKLIAKYDDTIAYLHAALRGAFERADAAESRLAAIEARLGAP